MATEDTQAQEALAATNAADNQAETQVQAGQQEEVAAQTEESAEDQNEGTSEDQPSAEPEQKPARPSGVQRLKSRLAQAEAELAQYKSQPKAAGDDIEARVRARLGEPPKEADFNGDYVAYERKLTAYETAEMLARGDVSREIEREKAQAEIAQREATYEHEERVKAAEKRIPDFKQVVSSAKDLWLSDTVSQLVVNSDKSADLLYTIAKNPDIAEELNELSPLQAARRLGQIEARLTVPQSKKATGAPAPNSAVRGGAAPSSPDADLSSFLKKTYGTHLR